MGFEPETNQIFPYYPDQSNLVLKKLGENPLHNISLEITDIQQSVK
jgi:hypothetical protein